MEALFIASNAFALLGRVAIFDATSATAGVETEFLDFRLLWERGIPVPLPRWVLRLGAALEIRTRHRVFELP